MNAQTERLLANEAIESAKKLWGTPVKRDSKAIYFQNETTGKIKRVTYKFLTDTVNSLIKEIKQGA